MKISLCAFMKKDQSLEEQIAAAVSAGISLVEFEGANGVLAADMTESDLSACRAAFDGAGLTVYSVASDLGNIGIGDRNHNANEFRLLPTMAAAKALGAKNLRIFLHTVTEEQKNHDGVAFAIMVKTNRFNHLGDQFLMCIENGTPYFADTEVRTTYALDRLYLARSVFNPAAYLAAGKDELAAAVKTLLPRAAYVRVNDAYLSGAPAKMGEGDCNLPALLAELRKDTVLSLSPEAESLQSAASATAQMLTALGYQCEQGAWVL